MLGDLPALEEGLNTILARSAVLGNKKEFGRTVIKGYFPSYNECSPRLHLWENRRKITNKEIPSWLIPHQLD